MREGGLADYSGSEIFWSVMLPDDLVMLPDGRIGGPESTLLPANHEAIQQAEVDAGITRPAPLESEMVTYRIYAQDPTQDGRWVLDETLGLCARDCDVFYAEAESYYQSSVPIQPATPAATPSTDAASLQPIYPEECMVEPLSDEEISAIIRESGDEAERSYAPTGPVDDALADEIAEADRAWQSCFVFGAAGERAALQSPHFTREGPRPDPFVSLSIEDELAQLAQFDARRDLSEAMLTGDWRDYLIESDLFAEGTPAALQIPDFIPTIPIPEQATLLADGRVAIPIARLDPPGIYPHAVDDVDDIPYWWIPVHVLAQDPTQDDRWVIDETFTVCMGDCDLARAQTVDYIAYLESLVTTPDAATPAATPVASGRARSKEPACQE